MDKLHKSGILRRILTIGFFIASVEFAFDLKDSYDVKNPDVKNPDQGQARAEGPPETSIPFYTERCASCPSGDEAKEITGAALAAMEKRVREFDAAFTNNNIQSFLSLLGSGEGPGRRQLECELRESLQNAIYLSRESKIIKAIRIGDSDAAYVTTEMTLRPRSDKPAEFTFDRRQHVAQVLFFSWNSNRNKNTAPVLARVERFDEDAAVLLNSFRGRIGCAPCNWNIERPAGWFLIPRVAGEGASFDSISFVHSNLNISIDFDCYTNPTVQCPLSQAERDHDMLLQIMGMKPAAATLIKKNAVMEGAALRADVIADYPDCIDPKVTTRIYRCYRLVAPFLFNFVVRGDARELAAHQYEIGPLLESLHINKDDFADPDRIERVSKTHMTVAKISATKLIDEDLGLALTPPEGWPSTTQPGVGRFCIRYHSPADENVSLAVFTWDGDVRCFGEQEIQHFFEKRRASMPAKEYNNWKISRAEVSEHQNGVDVSFEIESEWVSGAAATKDRPMRELFVAIPLGRYLCCFVARAPKDDFDKYKETFTKTTGSLRHALKK